MQITVAAGNITQIDADTIVVPLAQGVRTLTGETAAADQVLGGVIAQMLG